MSEADIVARRWQRSIATIVVLACLLIAYKGYLVLTAPTELSGLDNVEAFTLANQARPASVLPEPVATTYAHGTREYVYSCQEAPGFAQTKTLLIYAHGAEGTEVEGMAGSHSVDTFMRLRAEILSRNWHYISIRNYEFDGLIAHLNGLYKPERIYLCGLSLGGRQLFEYMLDNPEVAAGVVLGCPAVAPDDASDRRVKYLKMPVFIMAGEDEPLIAPFCRSLAAHLHYQGARFKFLEYPDGGHCDPFREVNWKAVFDFVAGPAV